MGHVKRPFAGASAALLAAMISAVVGRKYRRDIRRARERVTTGSQIAETSGGPIEYGSAGEGSPVLVVHGAGGGFDQGLEVAGPLTERGFRIIAMSRFGYLRAPLPTDASAAAQADAHARLLDALKSPRVAVLGASAGAPSAMQFALRYPERTAALVLVVPAAYPFHGEPPPGGTIPTRTSFTSRILFDAALRSDFLFWVARRIAPAVMCRAILGTPPSLLRHAGAEERIRVTEVLDHIQPMSLRRRGLLNDASVLRSLPRYDLERIAAPTLILGVADCLFGTYDGARYCSEHIPGARFVGYPAGGHLWVGHQADVMAEIAEFLRDVRG